MGISPTRSNFMVVYDSIWAEHLRNQGVAQRMRNEPNVDTWVCVKKKELQALIWLYVGRLWQMWLPCQRGRREILGGGGFSYHCEL